MIDYEAQTDYQNGEFVDMNIEWLIGETKAEAYLKRGYDAKKYNDLFTRVMQEYINSNCPDLLATHAASDMVNNGAMTYLHMLKLDFYVIFDDSPNWPGFSNFPKATTAISVLGTEYVAATNFNQATLLGLLALAKDVAINTFNSPRLDLGEDTKH